MRLNDYIKSGQTNLKRSRLRTFLTIFAIVIGTFTLAMTTAFGQGLQQIIDAQLQAYNSPNLVDVSLAGPPKTAAGSVPAYQPGHQTAGNDPQPDLNQSDLDVLKTMPFTSDVYPDEQLNADYVQYGTGRYVVSVSSVFPGDQVKAVNGTVPTENGNGILLPYPYIQTFGASDANTLIGKTVVVRVSSQANPTDQKNFTFTIDGFLANTVHAPNAFVSVSDLNSMVNFQTDKHPVYSDAALITSSVLSPTQDGTLKSALAAKGYAGQSYIDVQNHFKQPLQVVQYGLDAFALIALLAAAIGIINTLLMSVLERTQEVGLMKALGMRRGGIFTLFIAEAVAIGFWGGVIGVVAAWALGSSANALLIKGVFRGVSASHILTFPIGDMLLIIVGAIILGVLAGALPALRASRLDPIEALRRE